MKKSATIVAIAGIIFFGTGILLAHVEHAEDIISEITSATINADTIPVVNFTLQDSEGGALTLDDVDSIRFLIASIEEDDDTLLTRYRNYFVNEVEGTQYNFQGETREPALASVTQPTFESGEGVFAEIEPGSYTYTFGQALGEDYDARRTHVIGAEIIRGPRDIAANPTFTFVPEGGEPRLIRQLIDASSCDNCHQDIGAHGGSRKQPELCVLCHTPDNIDPETGNSLDMKVMIHRIHSGEKLPSVQTGEPYFIVGHRQSVHDYSSVVWPQDTRNCATCHTGTDDDNYLDFPNVAACSSCHDDVDPTISLNHTGNPKDDEDCYRCHDAKLIEFDEESILGTHLLPRNSSQVMGVNLEIISVDALAGQSPSITLRVTRNDDTAIPPDEMDYLAVTVAGPTSDYLNRVTETIFRAPSETPPSVEDMGDGAFRYTLAFVMPESTGETYAFGLEGYVMEELDDVDDPVRIAGFNPITYVSLDDSAAAARREVINPESCNDCHDDLALHGTIRQNTQYCVMCHTPNATDEARRPAEAMPPVSINFREMIHRIHRGEEASQSLAVYGFGNSLHDYSQVGFPGEIANCETCHLDGTYDLELAGLQPTTITQAGEVISEILPARAVCTSCHDTVEAGGHSELQTTDSGIETCTVCHGAGKEFDVMDSHP